MKNVLFIFLPIVALLVLAAPAMAQPEDGYPFCLNVTIEPIGEYSLEGYFNDIVIDECGDFDVEYFDLGYIEYSVCTNMPWMLTSHWEYECDFAEGQPFPEDWQIWWFNGDEWLPLTTDEAEETLAEGDCGDFEGDEFFALTGPDICDEPALYNGEIEFHLGPA